MPYILHSSAEVYTDAYKVQEEIINNALLPTTIHTMDGYAWASLVCREMFALKVEDRTNRQSIYKVLYNPLNPHLLYFDFHFPHFNTNNRIYNNILD